MSTLVEIKLLADQTEGTQATIAQWLKKPGDQVIKNEPIVELETDKVMMEVTATESGILNEILLQEGETVEAEQIMGTIRADSESMVMNSSHNAVDSCLTPKKENRKVLEKPTAGVFIPPSIAVISPAVRRLSRQHDIPLENISGSGKNGRITTRDINSYLKNHSEGQPVSGNLSHNSELLPHSTMRKRIAEHMHHSLSEAPHVTAVFEMDLSRIITHRKQHKSAYLDKNVNLTYTAYFIAASVAAIKAEPKINSRFHAHGLEIFKNINIGIGTALGDAGLIVPVIKHCEQLNLFSIAKQLTETTQKARENKLSQQDVQNGTFTISNHGVSGSLVATPIIINQPQSAILGIGKMEKRVVVREVNGSDAMLIKPMCYVSLTIDHRALDAFQTNRFLTEFVNVIENWNT